jgi:hypothetical protein
MAAPVVAGAVAVLLAEAKARGIDLGIDRIRELLAETARPQPGAAAGGWDKRYGHGKLSVAGMLAGLPAAGPVLVSDAAGRGGRRRGGRNGQRRAA